MSKRRIVDRAELAKVFGLRDLPAVPSHDRLRISGASILPDPDAPPVHECRHPRDWDGVPTRPCVWTKCPRKSPCPLDHFKEWLIYLR